MLRSRDPQICHFHGRCQWKSGSVRSRSSDLPPPRSMSVKTPLVKRLGGRERQLHGRMSGQFIQLATYDVSDLTLIAPASSQHWAPAKTKRVRCQLHPHDSLMGGVPSPPGSKASQHRQFYVLFGDHAIFIEHQRVEQAAPLHSSRGATGS